jgi:hypothetical protein
MKEQQFTPLLLCAICVSMVISRARADVIQSTWTGSGATNSWTDTANWSHNPSGAPAYPNNTITDTYQATIGFNGADAHLSTNVTVDSVTLNLNPTLTAEPAGQLNVVNGMQINDGVFDVGGGFSGGTFAMSSGNTNVSGTFSATNATISGGVFQVNSGGHVSATAMSLSSSLLLNGGSVSTTNGVSVSSGQINGSGTISGNVDIADSSELSPGTFQNPTLVNGIVHVDGGLSVAGNGTIRFDIGDTAASGDFDKVSVNGTATLGGFLTVRVFDDWVSSGPGETYTLLTATTLVDSGLTFDHPNAFDRIVVTNQNDDEVGTFHVLIDSTSLSLTNFQPIPEPSSFAAFAILAAGFRRLSKRQKPCRRA